MKNRSIIAGVVLCFVVLVTVGIAENKFVGSKKCATCHKVEKLGGVAYTLWEKSAHAKAYQTLMGDQAKKIAKEKGLKAPAHESEACLKCHVTGGGVAKNIDASFKKEEGVGCEACHGPASAYLAPHAKKDAANKAKAKEGGLVSEKTAKACQTCHNAESPTYKEFKFEAMWAKIEHTRAAK
jgi:hypothetical protein